MVLILVYASEMVRSKKVYARSSHHPSKRPSTLKRALEAEQPPAVKIMVIKDGLTMVKRQMEVVDKHLEECKSASSEIQMMTLFEEKEKEDVFDQLLYNLVVRVEQELVGTVRDCYRAMDRVVSHLAQHEEEKNE